jgi:uncharacterized protein (TIGR03790 family)
VPSLYTSILPGLRPGRAVLSILLDFFLMHRIAPIALGSLLCLTAVAGHAFAQTAANVLLVVNDASPDSMKVAARYRERRSIPESQVVRIRTATSDEVSRPGYEREIQAPIAAWFSRNATYDRILYIVLTKGIPLRIAGTVGRTGTISSVDSELSLLYRKMTGAIVVPNGSIDNPYFLGDRDIKTAAHFTHATQDIFLVTRLDGFTAADAIALIDRGASPVTNGRVLLDQRASLRDAPNGWLAAAAEKLSAQGFEKRVVLDQTSRALEKEPDVLGYYSWGSNDPSLALRNAQLQFVPGAIAGMFMSSDARTLIEPPEKWRPGRKDDSEMFYRGSSQSLTGDLVRAGVTGVAGQVAEPYLDSSVRPDVLFPAYLAGFNLAEAFYLAIPALSWQTVVFGDPLCSPFSKGPQSAADLDPPKDEETEMPAHFSRRRLAFLATKSSVPAATRQIARAESRSARGDFEGARDAAEKAVALDERFIDGLRILASTYELLTDYPKAIGVYRKLVDRDPKDFASLNNLAYGLAVREGKPKEALPLAEKASLMAPTSANVLDTLGWTRHLLGDNDGALRPAALAAQAMTSNGEVQLHAAVIFAANGRLEDAAKLLKAAEQLDPALKERPEFKQLQQKLKR